MLSVKPVYGAFQYFLSVLDARPFSLLSNLSCHNQSVPSQCHLYTGNGHAGLGLSTSLLPGSQSLPGYCLRSASPGGSQDTG